MGLSQTRRRLSKPCLSVSETKSLEWNVRRLNPAGRGRKHGSSSDRCHSQAKIVGPFCLHYAVECSSSPCPPPSNLASFFFLTRFSAATRDQGSTSLPSHRTPTRPPLLLHRILCRLHLHRLFGSQSYRDASFISLTLPNSTCHCWFGCDTLRLCLSSSVKQSLTGSWGFTSQSHVSAIL